MRAFTYIFQNGGHGCILTFDLIDMYKNTKEIFKNNKISEADLKTISNDSFIDFTKGKLYY